MMPTNETDAQRWTRRAGDAAAGAVSAGADPEAVIAAVRAGIRAGEREKALRNGTLAPAAPAAQPFVPKPGSAAEALLRAVGSI